MTNPLLGRKLKDLRKIKGFSQEALADKAGISLKTIQRIESSQNEPTGDTILKITGALNIKPDDLLSRETTDDKNYLKALNASAVSFIVFPLLSIILPTIMWLAKKDNIRDLNTQAKILLNFQITWIITLLIGAVFCKFLIKHTIWFYEDYQISWYFLYSMYSLNFVYIIINHFRIKKSKSTIYSPQFNLIK